MQSDSAIGQVIDGYRILAVLGRGGMGIVYKAEDIALSRTVALKMIAPELAANESFLRRFHDEARALARVESPYIVGVHALRKSQDRFFIVMEFVDGWTLADVIEKGPVDSIKARPVLEQMLEAFARAHGGGVIHRDIKPRNIMLTQTGKVKVTDFGLAKLRQDDGGGSTVTQGMAGTARYMSPEQIQGTKIDHRSDLYSLGMTMYEMLAGQLPFDPDEGTFTILKRIVEEVFPSPVTFNPDIPERLVAVVKRAIEKKPEDRFQSAQEMLEAVKEAYKPVPEAPKAFVKPAPEPVLEPAGGKKKILLGGILALVIFGIYPVYSFFSGDGDDDTNVPLSEQLPVRPQDPVETPARLTVTTLPEGAMVYVDQKEIGVSPASLTSDEGALAVRASLAGYEQKDTLITVQPGQSHSIMLSLDKLPAVNKPVENPNTVIAENPSQTEPPPPAMGTLRLASVPAVSMQVDGKRYRGGEPVSLTAGRHQVRFEDLATGMSKDTTVTIQAGRRQEITCYFEHVFTVVTQWDKGNQAPWAKIFVNGRDIDEPTPFVNLKLGPGKHDISVSRQGYNVLEGVQSVTVEPVCGASQPTPKVFFTLEEE